MDHQPQNLYKEMQIRLGEINIAKGIGFRICLTNKIYSRDLSIIYIII